MFAETFAKVSGPDTLHNASLLLTSGERDALAEIIRGQSASYSFDGYAQFVASMSSLVAQFPDRLATHLRDFKAGRQSSDCLLIQNLPIGEVIPPTPTDAGSLARNRTDSATNVLGSIATALGVLYTIEGKLTHSHIDDIFAVSGDEEKQVSSNQTFLEWHVEDGFHPARADMVALLCLRGDPKALTLVSQARALQLSTTDEQILREPRFRIYRDTTFSDGERGRFERTPILSGSEEVPEIMFDPAYMECDDPEARGAFTRLREELNARHQVFALQAGELLLFDNRRVVHARTSYKSQFDGRGRWLKRGLILRDAQRAVVGGHTFSNGLVSLESTR